MHPVKSLLLTITMLMLFQAGWAREYVVDVNHQQASDENPGTVKPHSRRLAK